jgi:hypothetical protein
MNLRQEFKEVESYSGDRHFPSHFGLVGSYTKVGRKLYKRVVGKCRVRVRQK